MGINALDHVNIETARPDETIAFYTEVLGLVNRPERRPGPPETGAWLFLGDQAVIHLSWTDEDLGPTGSFNHVAFDGSDFAGMTALLDERGLDYRTTEHASVEFKQIFVRDPNGVQVEINIRGE